MAHFGDKFRKARESRELSLDDISNVTKISARMLQAIEEEHFDQLPGGVFNKGFIRAYAKHLGLNSEEAVNDYLQCLRQEQIDSHAGWDADQRTQSATPSKNTVAMPVQPAIKVQAPVEVDEELPELQLPRVEDIRPARKQYLGKPEPETSWTLIASIVVLILVAILLWTRHSRSVHTVAAKSSTPAPAAASIAPTTLPTAPAPAPTRPAPSRSSTAAANSTSTPRPAVPTASLASASQPVPASPAPNTQPVSKVAVAADPNQVKIERKGDVTIRSFGASATVPATKSVSMPATKPAASFTLVIRASENSWVSVVADGQLVTQETLIAPAANTFHASREIDVRVGNAAGVAFLLNGKELPPQGAEAEAKTFVFDAQGLRVPSDSPTQ
jgi:cytoskeleton protein RodZ